MEPIHRPSSQPSFRRRFGLTVSVPIAALLAGCSWSSYYNPKPSAPPSPQPPVVAAESGAPPAAPAPPHPEPGRSRLTPEQRAEVFQALWNTLNDEYVFFAEKQINWAHIRIKYEAELHKLTDDADFDRLLRRLVAEIRDTHAYLDFPIDDVARPPLRTMPDGEQIAISEVTPGSEAERAGFKAGMVLVSVNERPASEVWQELTGMISSSVPHRGRWGAARAVLNGLPGTSVTVTARGTDGNLVTATLERDQSPAAGLPPFRKNILEGDIAYMRVGSFDSAPVRDQFLAAMSEIAASNPNGLIIDVRNNGGGNQVWALELVGTLLRTGGVGAYVKDPRDGTYREFYINLAPTAYTGPVYVLVDPGCMSACDLFTAYLQRTGRAKLIGEPPAGATHQSSSKELPHGFTLHYGGARHLVDHEKHPLEGNPAQIDYPVVPTAADAALGRDPVLEKALELLRK